MEGLSAWVRGEATKEPAGGVGETAEAGRGRRGNGSATDFVAFREGGQSEGIGAGERIPKCFRQGHGEFRKV